MHTRHRYKLEDELKTQIFIVSEVFKHKHYA